MANLKLARSLLAAVSCSVLVAACGGGGGGGGDTAATATPAPTPTPTPLPISIPDTPIDTNPTPPVTPTPTPTPGGSNTAYINTTALAQMKANVAYAAGYTGAGVNVAVIDGGIASTSATNYELGGQVLGHYDATGTITGYNGANGSGSEHGTAMATAIAGLPGSNNVQGVAYGSKLYDINIFANGTNISRINTAVGWVANKTNGIDARIVSMSFNSLDHYSGTPTVMTSFRAAAAADKILVMAAGNEGASNPGTLAGAAADPLVNGSGVSGGMIVVGAVNSNNAIASYSNRAGLLADYYVVAPGTSISINQYGTTITTTGTSGATALVAGVAAVMSEYWPALTGKQVISIIESTATDLGAPGVDAVYGHGLVNIEGAMSPVGTMSLTMAPTTSAGSVPASSSLVSMSTAMSIRPGQAGVMVMDAYQRDYLRDLSSFTTRGASRSAALNNLAASQGRPTIANAADLLDSRAVRNAGFGYASSENSTYGRSDIAALSLSDNTIVMTANHAQTASLVAPRNLEPATSTHDALFAATQGAALPSGQYLSGGANGSAVATRLDDNTMVTASFATEGDAGSFGNNLAQVSAATTADNVQFGLVAGLLFEPSGLLGSTSQGAFGENSGYGQTSFLTGSAGTDLGYGWSLVGTATQAFVNSGAIATDITSNGLTAQSFALTAAGPTRLRAGDMFGLRLSQPLRVNGGALDAYMPVTRDAVGNIYFANQSISATPAGRELDMELAYATPTEELMPGSSFRINAVAARNPGNDATEPTATGGGVSWNLRF